MTNLEELLTRWRLVLGGDEDGNEGRASVQGMEGFPSLSGDNKAKDELMSQLYDGDGDGNGDSRDRGASLDDSMPDVNRWLGDINKYFPKSTVEVLQKDAIKRIGLGRMLESPDVVESLEPDVSLVSALITLKDTIPDKTKSTARIIVQKVVDDLLERLRNPMQAAIRGALDRARRNNRPKYNEIDWNRTIKANLKHYQEDYKTVIPERLIGYSRRRNSAHDVVILVDQSGSMAPSCVYASVFAAVMASIPSINTSMAVFDTSVVDMTPHLADPVDVLFGTMLGGGTDIGMALEYAQHELISRPDKTTMVLISDLYEGGNQGRLLTRAQNIKDSGVNMVALLALSDQGTPAYSEETANQFAGMGIPTFSCTPDKFPDLMAATMNGEDLSHFMNETEEDGTD